jgi:tRNA A-37 threonylcarbamoyl transferase component Bud32/tetratricopeptide (TPR) repeat protein
MNDDATRWQATEAIFHDALTLVEPERSALLNARCGGDTTLMAELRSLLVACEAEEVLRRSVGTEAVTPGTPIGPYVVDCQIGQGGMGAVYRAHRADGQFEQEVAIKIVDMPLASGVFRERFRAERQMLAGLTHPYIARLLDGGVSDGDELYLVMEFIDGGSITQFCKQRALTIDDRLRLFMKVCEAVQYAHGNLIVHRDLKPENILVAEDGNPRLLDFGTAKIVQPLSDDRSKTMTRSDLRTFTPAYASPEQVLDQPVSIASDIYSLGVLLYLLLTDSLPYKLANFTTEEMLKVICNEEPRRPSLAGAPFGKIDQDLDSIVLKALRKQPRQRYLTVEQFRADIQSHLDGLPVLARRGTFRYVAGKFVRRNKLALAGASLLCLTLLGGLGGVLWQARRADQEKRRAEARSADLRELSNSLLSELDEALKDIPGSTGAQKLLVTRVLEHMDRMAKDSHGDRQAGLDLVEAYTRLGDVQGNVYYQNVADTAGAVASFNRAIAIAEPLTQANPNDRDVLRAEAAALEARGETLSQSGDPQASASSLQAAVRLYDKVVHLPGVTPSLIFEAAIAYETLGNELGEDSGMADPESALAAYRKALDMDGLALALDPNYMAVRRGVPVMYMHLGAIDLETNPDKAVQEFQTALTLQEALPLEQRSKRQQIRNHAIFLRKLAQAFTEIGKYALAQALLAKSKPVFQGMVDADPNDVGALADLCRSLDAEAALNEDASDPELSNGATADRRRYTAAAWSALQKEAEIIRRIVQHSPSHEEWDQALASVLIRLNAVRDRQHLPLDSAATTARSLAILIRAAQRQQTAAGDIAMAVNAELNVQPSTLRHAALTVRLAERGVAMTHHREASYLLLLAKAYHAAATPAATHRNAAIEGLALLMPVDSGASMSRTRKQLEAEAR